VPATERGGRAACGVEGQRASRRAQARTCGVATTREASLGAQRARALGPERDASPTQQLHFRSSPCTQKGDWHAAICCPRGPGPASPSTPVSVARTRPGGRCPRAQQDAHIQAPAGRAQVLGAEAACVARPCNLAPPQGRWRPAEARPTDMLLRGRRAWHGKRKRIVGAHAERASMARVVALTSAGYECASLARCGQPGSAAAGTGSGRPAAARLPAHSTSRKPVSLQRAPPSPAWPLCDPSRRFSRSTPAGGGRKACWRRQ